MGFEVLKQKTRSKNCRGYLGANEIKREIVFSELERACEEQAVVC
jgi:hypothetical protein